MSSKKGSKISKYSTWYILSLPYLLFLFMMVIAPMAFLIVLSFFEVPFYGLSAPRFVGLKNFKHIMNDEIFWISFKNSLRFLAVLAPTWTLGSFILAKALMVIKGKARAIFMSTFYFPSVIAFIQIAVIWRSMYIPQIGFWPTLIRILFGIDVPLLSMDMAIYSLSLVQIWAYLGYFSLMFVAGLSAIPSDYQDAARIDGANWWQTLLYITLPLLRPVIFLIFFTSVAWSLSLIQIIYVMTFGGPANATSTIFWYSWLVGWQSYRMGYSCSILSIFLILLLALYLIQRKVIGGLYVT